MTDQLPDPLVPAEVDLRDFGFMPLEVVRLRDSDLAALATGDEFKAAVLLWCVSWHQVPPGSLPDDDRLLAKYSQATAWRKVKAGALRGFVKCSDGRLYHPVIAERVLKAWQEKLARIERTKAATEAREAKRRAEQAIRDAQRNGARDEHRDEQRDVARDVHQGKGEGREREREGKGISNTGELRSPVDDEPSAVDRPTLELVEDTAELPDCPHQELIALYRKHLPHLRQPARWDGERAEAMRTRWRECSQPTVFGDGYRTKAEGLAFWDRFFAYVATVPKLRDGITSKEHGQVRVWKPSLDWLVIRGNFTKVIEGAYAE